MLLRNILLLFVLTLPILTASQNIKISAEDKEVALRLKTKYPDNHAVILNSLVEITFESDKQGNIYALEKKTEEIMSLKINLELSRNIFYDSYSKIKKTTLKDHKGRKLYPYTICGNYKEDNIFHSDLKLCLLPIEISSLGEKKTVEIKKQYSDLKYLSKIFFATDLPTEYKRIVFNIPNWLDIELLDFNLKEFNIQKNSNNEDTKNNTQKVIEYRAKGLNSLKKEDNSLGLSSWQPHLLMLSKSINLPKSNQYLISNLDERYAWYKSLTNDLKADITKIKPLVNSIISNNMSDVEKIEKLFYWVQDHIRYVAYEEGIAGFKPDEAHNVLEKKYGDCKGMANLTKTMLTVAGFDARLTWLGTNTINYDYTIPSLSIDNHLICTVFLNDKKYFLDATEKFISLNDYAERIQGRPVLIEDKNKYILDSIPTFSPIRNTVSRVIDFKIIENTLTGAINTTYNGERKINLFRFLKSQEKYNENELLEVLVTDKDTDIEILTLKQNNLFKRNKPFNIASNVVIKNRITSFENHLYIDLDPYKDFASLSIDEGRLSSIYLGEKANLKTKITLKLPPSYEIKHVPKAIKISTSKYSITALYTITDNVIEYSKEFIFHTTEIPAKDFEVWENTLIDLNTFYNDQLILEKN